MNESFGAGSFQPRLGRLLLVAFASGLSVEDEWRLTFDDEYVPDMRVSILRTDPGGNATSPDATVDTVECDQFEARLRSVLLDEFADGTEIEGSWTVRFVPESLPAWEVYVEVDPEPDVAADDPRPEN